MALLGVGTWERKSGKGDLGGGGLCVSVIEVVSI